MSSPNKSANSFLLWYIYKKCGASYIASSHSSRSSHYLFWSGQKQCEPHTNMIMTRTLYEDNDVTNYHIKCSIHSCFLTRRFCLAIRLYPRLRSLEEVKSALVNTNHIYSIPHLPYNGGFQFAGVNLQINFQFDTKK